jgi:hypothetical protein
MADPHYLHHQIRTWVKNDAQAPSVTKPPTSVAPRVQSIGLPPGGDDLLHGHPQSDVTQLATCIGFRKIHYEVGELAAVVVGID